MTPPPPAVEVHVEAPAHAWGPRAAAAWHLQHLWRTVQPTDDAQLPTPRQVLGTRGGEHRALVSPTTVVRFAPKKHSLVIVLDASQHARTARRGRVPLALAPPAIVAVLEAMTQRSACAPLEKIVVDAQVLVVAADDVVWRPCARVVVATGQEVNEAASRIAAVIRSAEKRLATHALEETHGVPSVERCARAGLFALRFCDAGGARTVVVATDGDGVAAPRDCGLLGGRAEGGAGAHARREGVALHVLDYAGAAFDDQTDATWGLVADWAGATIACERTGGGLVAYDPCKRRLTKCHVVGAGGKARVVKRRDKDVGASLLWRRSPLSLRMHQGTVTSTHVEQLAAYPLPRASLADVARLRASGPLDLIAIKIQTASQKRRPRVPLAITWELPRVVDDATTLRYVVELRPPPPHELAAEAKRRNSRTATPADLAAAALHTRAGAVSARIEVVGPLSVVEALRTLPPLENLGVAALGPPDAARSLPRRSRKEIARHDDESRTPSTSRSPSPQRDEAAGARARRLRDLAAWLLRRDGALSAVNLGYGTEAAEAPSAAPELKPRVVVESVLDHLRSEELGHIQEDIVEGGRARSRRKRPTRDALERLVAALPARDLAALADVERFHVATRGPEAGAARRVADALARWGRPVQGVHGAYARKNAEEELTVARARWRASRVLEVAVATVGPSSLLVRETAARELRVRLAAAAAPGGEPRAVAAAAPFLIRAVAREGDDDIYGTPHAVAQRWLRTSLAGFRDTYDAHVVDGAAALAAFRASREALGFTLADERRTKGNVVACLLVADAHQLQEAADEAHQAPLVQAVVELDGAELVTELWVEPGGGDRASTAVVLATRAALQRRDGRAHAALRALRALGSGGRGASHVDGAAAVALATYATRTLALDLATFGHDDNARKMAAQGVSTAIAAALDAVATNVQDGCWVAGLTNNAQLGEACALVAEVCENDGSAQGVHLHEVSARDVARGYGVRNEEEVGSTTRRVAGSVKRSHAAAYARGALQLLGVSKASPTEVTAALESVRWVKAVSADASVAAFAARALAEDAWHDADEAIAEAWVSCAFRELGDDLFAFCPSDSDILTKEEDERRSASPGRLPETVSGFFARARQESGRPLEVDVGLVGDETLSAHAIAKCEELMRAVDAVLAAAALHARLASPTPIPDGGGGLAAALKAVSARCVKEQATRFRPGLDARRLSCRIDVVAFAGDDAGVGDGAMPAGLEGFLRRALCERSSWAKPDEARADGDPSENAALAVERRLTRIAFRAVAGAYVVVDARDVTQAPTTYLASVRVATCQIHYHARQADVIALPKRRYGGPVPTGAGHRSRGPGDRGSKGSSHQNRGRQINIQKDKAPPPPSGDAVAAGLATTIALVREKRGMVGEDADDAAVARTLRCALSRASRVASQLRLLSGLAATRHAHELLIPAGGGGHADVDVSPFSCELLMTVPVPLLKERSGFCDTKLLLDRLAKYLAETPSQLGKAAAPVVNRPRVYVFPRHAKILPATPADANDGSSCYARLWSPDDRRCELRIFGCRPFSDASSAACAAAFASDVAVVARRALISDFFAKQGVERCASLNIDGDDLDALGVPSATFRTRDVALEKGRSLGAAAAGLRRTASGYFGRDQFASRPVELQGCAAKWDALFPATQGEGVRLCLAALPDKEPGFRAALCDLRLEDGVARASWALFGGDGGGKAAHLGGWLERVAARGALAAKTRAAASRWLAVAPRVSSRLGARRLQSALKTAHRAGCGDARASRDGTISPPWALETLAVKARAAFLKDAGGAFAGNRGRADILKPRVADGPWRVVACGRRTPADAPAVAVASIHGAKRSLYTFGVGDAAHDRVATALGVAARRTRDRQRDRDRRITRATAERAKEEEAPRQRRRSRKKRRSTQRDRKHDVQIEAYLAEASPWWGDPHSKFVGPLRRDRPTRSGYQLGEDDSSSEDGGGRDQLPSLMRYTEDPCDDDEAATCATILRVAVRRPARKRRADHVHAWAAASSDSSDGERRFKDDEHDCGPEATEVAEASSCALAFRAKVVSEWRANGFELERTTARSDLLRCERTGGALLLKVRLQRSGPPVTPLRRARSVGGAPEADPDSARGSWALVADVRTSMDGSTRGGAGAAARALLARAKVESACTAFAARLAGAACRRRGLLQRRDAAVLLVADVLARKSSNHQINAQRLEGAAFVSTWHAAPVKNREGSPSRSFTCSRVFGMHSEADGAGAAWAVGAAARIPWHDDDGSLSGSSGEASDTSSDDGFTETLDRPPAPKVPFGVRLANRGAALVHVHGSRDVVSAYACGAEVSPDFWAACRTVAARADARGAAATAASKLAKAGAGALDRATLKRHASHFLRRPLARWAPALTEVLRRRTVPWDDVLQVVATARNVKLASSADGRRPSYTVPLISRNDACVAALVVVAATAETAARADVVAARNGPPLDAADLASIRRAARDVLAALLLRVDLVCAADRAPSPERSGRPALRDVFKTSPELRRDRDALYRSDASSDRSSPRRSPRTPSNRRSSPRRRRRSLSGESEVLTPPVPAVEVPAEGCVVA